MKLKELIEKLDKSDANESWISINDDDLRQELGLPSGWVNTEAKDIQLKAYFLFKWYCTDSYVGYRGYFLNDELVAVSTQMGRKCSEVFEWVSTELYKKTKEYIRSLMDDNDDEPNLNILDLDEVIPDYGMQVDFSEQILGDKAYLVDTKELVKITKRNYGYDTNTWKKVEIELSTGEKKVVDVTDVIIPYCVI